MATMRLPDPTRRTTTPDLYGHARLPADAASGDLARVERVPYGRFRNVYLYITEACQLRCAHCYMGDRLERALKLSLEQAIERMDVWRRMGGSKLTILGGEPTLHPDFEKIARAGRTIGYEHVILTTNGLEPAIRKLRRMEPEEWSYVQVSLDGGSADSHDAVRGAGRFESTLRGLKELCERGFDTRIICTVNQRNIGDCLELLDIADEFGVSLTKFHVFSTIGLGRESEEWSVPPRQWIDFCDHLGAVSRDYTTRVWFQPTYTYRDRLDSYVKEGYRGCVGRTLDRISIFPDGRAYVCSYLFDTDYHFAEMEGREVRLTKGVNEFDLFNGVLAKSSCGSCAAPDACSGGCPAEELVMGQASCSSDRDIIPVCRLWKADV